MLIGLNISTKKAKKLNLFERFPDKIFVYLDTLIPEYEMSSETYSEIDIPDFKDFIL